MKLKCYDGSLWDTDNLNDLSAEIAEKTSEYCSLMEKYQIPFLLRYYDPMLKGYGGAMNLNGDPEQFVNWLKDFNYFLRKLTKGRVQVVIHDDSNSI